MQKKNHIAGIFPILLFLVFTLSALGVVLFSVRVYQHIIEQSESDFASQTAVSYVTEKFRGYDTDGQIGVGEFAGHQAITLKETVSGVQYVTYIYTYDGYLRELFTEEALSPALSENDGNRILEMQDMQITQLSDRLLKLQFMGVDGKNTEAYLSIHSRGGM